MSTYVREKVLRIPMDRINMNYIKEIVAEKCPDKDIDDDFANYAEFALPHLFDYGEIGKFQIAPTEESFIDYVLDYEWDAYGEYGKTRALYNTERVKYLPIFKQIDPEINMHHVRLVEFCWYNGTEAPDYYDDEHDDFYDEV